MMRIGTIGRLGRLGLAAALRSSFSPISLFSAGEQGIWLEPSDVANLAWRRNLLTFTEQFDNAAWVKTRTTVTSNAVIAPDGTLTADTLTASADDPYVQQNIVASSRTYTWSVYLKGAGSSIGKQPTLRIGRDDYTELFNLIAPALTANWQRYIFSATFVTTPVFNVNARVDFVEGNDLVGLTVDFWGAQLELGSSVTDYQRISDVNTEVVERFPTTTMFTDRAGTTLVTTPGQTVGLRLDKSKGLTLGAELVTNGDFSGGSTGWTTQSGWTISGGTANATTVTAANVIQTGILTVGKFYQISFTVSNFTAGFGAILVITPTFTNVTGNGTYTVRGVANSTNFQVYAGATSSFSVDNISVKELPGNHAVAPTDAARPTYGIEPWSGRRNVLTFTEDLSNAVWALDGSVSRSGNTLTFTSTSTDRRYALFFNSATTPVSGNTYVLTARFTVASGSEVIALGSRAGNASFGWLAYNTSTQSSLGSYTLSTPYTSISFLSATQVSTDVWDLSVLITANANNISPIVNFGANGQTPSQLRFNGNGTSSVSVTRFQLELGSTVTNYQRVGTAFDVTEAGVPTVHYVEYNGIDDSFSTSSINFTATDKMSVFAGVRKLSDAAQGIFVELSASTLSNNGTFNMQAPSDAGFARYRFTSKGTISSGDFASGYAAPISSVLTGLGDISGDTSTLRVNGIQVSQATTDQGTGNFGNYPLFIGRRNNATLPFNGRDYGIIIVGKNASASEITNTESYLASNTSGVTL